MRARIAPPLGPAENSSPPLPVCRAFASVDGGGRWHPRCTTSPWRIPCRFTRSSTTSPVSIDTRTTVSEAWDALQALEVRHLPVINEDRELVGIVSDRDFGTAPSPRLMTELLGESEPSPRSPVTTIMTAEPLAVEQDAEVDEVIDLMLENKVGAIPVVTPENQVIGIVSYLDILRKLGAQLS